MISYLQKELGAAIKLEPTATEQLIELFKAQQIKTKDKTDDAAGVQQDAKHAQKV